MKKKEILPLTKEELKLYHKQFFFHICKKGFTNYNDNDKKYYKIRDHCHHTGKYRDTTNDICN